MLDDHAGAGTLEKDVGHDVIVDLYESSILIARDERAQGEAPGRYATARAPCLRRLEVWSLGMPPQAWT